jgi:hypothetical protein
MTPMQNPELTPKMYMKYFPSQGRLQAEPIQGKKLKNKKV